STTRDGSVLFFTSALRQTGSDQPVQGKIFEVSAGGVDLLLSRTREWYPGGIYFGTTNYYTFAAVDIAGNGSAIAVSAGRECYLTTYLCSGSNDQTAVYNSQGELIHLGAGKMTLSPNGDWGLTTERGLGSNITHRIVDLRHNQEYVFPVTAFSDTASW